MVVNFYSFYIFVVVKSENFNPPPRLATIRTSAFNNIIVRTTVVFSIKSINRAKVRTTTIRALHKLFILLYNSFNELGVHQIPKNFRAELFACLGGEGVAVVADIFKRGNIFVIGEEIFKNNAGALDAGIGAEKVIIQIGSGDNVDVHSGWLLSSFCI